MTNSTSSFLPSYYVRRSNENNRGGEECALLLQISDDDEDDSETTSTKTMNTRTIIDNCAIPKERTKTVIAALLLFISSLCTSFSLSFLNEVVPRDRPLPDIVFAYVPLQEWAWPASDLLVFLMASVCGFSMLLHRYRWLVMRRIFLIASVLYYLRSFAMLVTWMPLSDRYLSSKCITPMRMRSSSPLQSGGNHSSSASTMTTDPREPSEIYAAIPWSMIGVRMVKYGLSLGLIGMDDQNRVLCGDYIYSGHTLMYVLTTLTMRAYFPRTGFYGFLQRLYPIAMVGGMILVVICRLHYTIDVLIAYWMTTFTFWCYHLLINVPRCTSTSDRYRSAERSSSTTTTTTTTSYFDAADPPNDPTEERSGFFDKERNTNNMVHFNLFASRLVIGYFEKNIPAGFNVPRRMNWPYDKPGWLKKFINRRLNDAGSDI